MLRRCPVDYALVARALWEAVQIATGLDGNSVLMAEPQGPVANRPASPFCTYKLTTSAMMYGEDYMYPTLDADGATTGFYYAGPRGIEVAFDLFGRDTLEAYSLGTALQTALWQEDAALPLNSRNMSVWSTGDVVDLSMLLDTGFEGRSHLVATIGVTAVSDPVLVPVSGVDVTSIITDDSLNKHQLDLSATLEGGS